MRNLRNCFNRLATTKIPTGDPNCPPSVKQAKRIYYGIKEKASFDTSTKQALEEQATSSEMETPLGSSSRRPKKKLKGQSNDRLLEYLIESEKLQAKRERANIRRQEKKEYKEDRRRFEERQETWRMAFGMVNLLASAFGGKELDVSSVMGGGASTARKPPVSDFNTDGSSSDVLSCFSDDSGKKRRSVSGRNLSSLRYKQKKMVHEMKESGYSNDSDGDNSPRKTGAI